MQLFYNSTISTEDTQIDFNKEESRHIAKVLRHSRGDILHVTNGKGIIFKVELREVNQKYCEGIVLDRIEHPPLSYRLHIAIAPTKSNDRFEWFLEKATELGISQITPIICEHSERRTVKMERMTKIIESAVKQSLSAYMPILNPTVNFKSFVEKEASFNGLKCIAHCYDEAREPFFQQIQDVHEVLVLIGPEGDFSLSELRLAQNHGFVPVSLGNRRLRTETAGIFVCAQLSSIN